jgi:hypothetical protein
MNVSVLDAKVWKGYRWFVQITTVLLAYNEPNSSLKTREISAE